ncbi:sodium-dependent transporter [Anaerobaca lacustris]|uniref:Transporter n=1 Tax=Anaerobaca lacustris TaxID=3044600 RepID=A0AAW6U2S7_9BACT|nr:sodium-dependent transporter [Sedimentisphaerales bacterium M17dextr]
MEERGKWGTNLGFLLAAIGSAVGLGNIWRFPYVAYENGGGAFLIPYFVALFTAGIPILMLEFALGHHKEASAPKAFRHIDAKWEWLGWWAVLFVMFGIQLYYTVIIGWCVNYMCFSLTMAWGDDPDAFFSRFLGRTDPGNIWAIQGFQGSIVVAVALVWLIDWGITYGGVQKGIERAVKVMMPVLILVTVGIVVWALFLEGAGTGIRHYVTPDFGRITDLEVWIAAYGQIFFSLSLGFGIMIAYSSYLSRDANIFKNSLIVGFANSSYEVFAGFGVFSILGYMAVQQNKEVGDVVRDSLGLAFVAYPQAISLLPFGRLFGVLFFLLLAIAGISSSISIIEAFVSAIQDKFSFGRKRIVTVICAVGFTGSLLFTTNVGLFWLDIVDHFLNHYGLIVVGIVEALVVGWLYRTDRLKAHIVANLGLSGTRHKVFNYIVLQLWMYCIRFVTPVALGIAIVHSLVRELATPYGGYPISAVIILGVGWLLVTHIFAFGLSGLPWRGGAPE